MPDTPIAFVTPWYGDISGGMEAETRRTVQQLARAGCRVEVWTTCIRDFHADWSHNHHRPGVSVEHGITVRRFKVGGRDKAAFDAVNAELMRGRVVSAESAATYIHNLFTCPDLYAHIAARRDDYLFVFIPYMFPTTVFGAAVAPARSAVIPCLHDEAYAYLDIYRAVLPAVHTLILHTHAEAELAERLYGPPGRQVRAVIGEGVDTDVRGDADRFRDRYQQSTPFLLYAGRKEAGKNVPLLIDYWERYVRERRPALHLLLLGKGEVAVAPDVQPFVRDLGFVPAQDKADAFAAATLFCNPSVNESFSLVIMESWLAQTPVIVNGQCAVTVEHCRRSQGGLYFGSYAEFAAVIDYVLAHPTVARRLGRNGRDYVLDHFQWPHVIAQLRDLLDAMARDRAGRPAV